MRPRDERAHPVVRDALDQGFLDTGAIYHVDGFEGHEAANEARKSVNRAGQHLNVSTPCWVVDQGGESCYKACTDQNAPHGIRFRLHSKDQARQHVVQQTGGDPSKLKFNPFARGQAPLLDDSGRRV
jgi:hypothetical protein